MRTLADRRTTSTGSARARGRAGRSWRRPTAVLVGLTLGAGLLAGTVVGAVVGASPSQAATTVLSRDKAIHVPDSGDADLYPSSIAAAGLGVGVSDVQVTLDGLTEAKPNDLDIELVGPDGTAVALMSDVCGQAALSQATLTFDDAAASGLPSGRGCGTGSWRPTDVDTGGDTWAVTPTASALSAFDGRDPNGVWRLYVRDDNDGGGEGVISDGWSLRITTTADPVISIPGPAGTDGGGVASPYPFTIPVSGLTKRLLDVNVTIPGLTHPAPGTLVIALTSPQGTTVVLMAGACGRTALADVTLTFDDAADGGLNPAQGTCSSGTRQPTDQDSTAALPAPAPAGPYATKLSALKNQNPNGTWSLYVLDTASHDTGYISGTPKLSIRTDTRPPRTKLTKHVKARTTRHKVKITFTSDEPGSTFQCKVDRRRWHRCHSPLKLKKLRLGRHHVRIRAVDPAGNRDKTPAVVTWVVQRPH